jgi:hypothetical protein
MLRSVLITTLLLIAPSAQAQCDEPLRNKVLLVGDSWAFFMGVDQTLNEQLAKWGHSGYRYYTNLVLAENGAETDDFLGLDKQAEIAERLLADPDITVVHLSLGGNDVLGDWNVNFSAAETEALKEQVFSRLRQVIDFILAVRPDVHVLWSGYMYPNFEEVIDDIAPLQVIHPFHGTWQGMGFPTFEQLNVILNDFSATLQAYTDTMDRVSFVNATGLMQYTFGQPQPLGVPPGGSYAAGTVPLPAGLVDYPSPKASMRNYGVTRDCFHLSAGGYRDMVDLHMRKFYHKYLMRDQYLLSSGVHDGSLGSFGSVSASLRFGNAAGERFNTVLTFPTSAMQAPVVEAASIFLRRTSLQGTDPIGPTISVKVRSGGFGDTFALVASDLFAEADVSSTACRQGSTAGDGHWIRIDLPEAMLPFLTLSNNTQFMLEPAGFTEGLVTFTDASDPELAPVLDLRFAEVSTDAGSIGDMARQAPFPNPTTGVVNLALPEGTTLLGVEVHDITGRLVAMHAGESTAIDLSHQTAGHYLLTILTHTGRTMHHLVKW